MNPPKKLTSRQQSEQQQESHTDHQTRAGSSVEFENVEEMLRHDALHTPVPPQIEHRLAKSIQQEPSPPQPWWKRLFGKGS